MKDNNNNNNTIKIGGDDLDNNRIKNLNICGLDLYYNKNGLYHMN